MVDMAVMCDAMKKSSAVTIITKVLTNAIDPEVKFQLQQKLQQLASAIKFYYITKIYKQIVTH